VFALHPEIENYTVFDVSDRLREPGWLTCVRTDQPRLRI
jgi:hypothetical protein